MRRLTRVCGQVGVTEATRRPASGLKPAAIAMGRLVLPDYFGVGCVIERHGGIIGGLQLETKGRSVGLRGRARAGELGPLAAWVSSRLSGTYIDQI